MWVFELIGFDQDQYGVTAHVRHHQDDIVSDVIIRASYLIGTDGAKGEHKNPFMYQFKF